MKIEKKETDFEPVTITLQSQDELDLFYQVFRELGGDVPAFCGAKRHMQHKSYVSRVPRFEKIGAWLATSTFDNKENTTHNKKAFKEL